MIVAALETSGWGPESGMQASSDDLDVPVKVSIEPSGGIGRWIYRWLEIF